MGPLAVSPFEMHPLKIAYSLASLNELCNGRAVVGLGGGDFVDGLVVYLGGEDEL